MVLPDLHVLQCFYPPLLDAKIKSYSKIRKASDVCTWPIFEELMMAMGLSQ